MSKIVAANPYSVVRDGAETLYRFGSRSEGFIDVCVTHYTGDFEGWGVSEYVGGTSHLHRKTVGVYDAKNVMEALGLAGYAFA